jgi:hypothetical protein
MQEFLDKVQDLRATNYAPAAAAQFAREFPPSRIIQDYLWSQKVTPSQYELILEAWEAVLQTKEVFRDIFLTKEGKSESGTLLSYDAEEIIDPIGRAVWENRGQIATFLKDNATKDPKEVDEAFRVLFQLCFDNSTATFSSAKRLFQYLVEDGILAQIATPHNFWVHIKAAINGSNSLSRIRSFELLSILSRDNELDTRAASEGLYTDAFSLYDQSTGDLLERLGYIDVLKHFFHASSFFVILNESGIIEKLRAEAINPATDMAVRRDLMVVLLNFMMRFNIQNQEQLFQEIAKQFLKLFSQDTQSKGSAFEIGIHLFSFVEAFPLLLGSTEVLGVLRRPQTLPEHLEKKALAMKADILTDKKFSLATKKIVEMDQQTFLALLAPLTIDSDQSEDLKVHNLLSRVFKECVSPFADNASAHFSVAKRALGYPEILAEALRSPLFSQFAEFLLETSGNNADQIAEKRALKSQLILKLKTLPPQKEPFEKRRQEVLGVLGMKENANIVHVSDETAN